MLSKKFRLKGKDVRFLTKKRQYCPAGIFGIFYFNQYPNNKFNQISCHISIKVSKRATVRNMIKRIVINYIRQNNLIGLPFRDKFYKMFFTLNKNKIPELKKIIESKNRKIIVKYVEDNLSYGIGRFKSGL